MHYSKMDLRFHQGNFNCLEKNYNTRMILFFIKDMRVCIKPLQNRLEAIPKLRPLMTTKGCGTCAGMVNFLSIFCPELQKLLKPIYNLQWKVDNSYRKKNNR